MPIVELNGVRKVYDTKVAVDNISLRIQPGTMFGLLGPNGSGKTSTIRMMIGITIPDAGTVSLFGEPFKRDNLKRVGYLPEERGLYKKMNVLEQLAFFGELHGLSETESKKRTKSWTEKLQITEALPKKAEELSKGMQQKIQFISALMHDPELVIMDEPFSGLDPVNATILQDVLIELRNAGRAILFSTHRMDQVEKMCDEIALVHRGHLVLSGSMRDIKSRYPRNRVHINYEGDSSFLQHPSIAEAKNFPGYSELTLREDIADAQPILAHAITNGTRIWRFDVVEPTLEDIFITTVGGNVDA